MNEDALFCVGQKAFVEKGWEVFYIEVDDWSDYFDALKKYFEQN